MVTRDFSGEDVYKVLVDTGHFTHVRTNGDHIMLQWTPPDHHDAEPRQVTVPLHDRIRIGTLRTIADSAGAQDFDEFCRWIDRNR